MIENNRNNTYSNISDSNKVGLFLQLQFVEINKMIPNKNIIHMYISHENLLLVYILRSLFILTNFLDKFVICKTFVNPYYLE